MTSWPWRRPEYHVCVRTHARGCIRDDSTSRSSNETPV